MSRNRKAALWTVLICAVAGAATYGALRFGSASPAAVSSKACLATTSPQGAGEAFIPGGTFDMGADGIYKEEFLRPRVTVKGFWIDRTEVTNAEFAAFVKATGYVTLAERGPTAAEAPDIAPEQRVPGGAVFVPPETDDDLQDMTHWWRFVRGADWRHPDGPGSSIKGRDNEPVVQIAYTDALAYAHWRGRDLPTEAEWEWAARHGGDGSPAPANPKTPPSNANVWQGSFPNDNTVADGYRGRAPVGCFAPDADGVYDMLGNVWEWTSDLYESAPGAPVSKRRRVIKGGSFLCAANFCARYRPAARQPGEADFSTSHIGFRTIRRAG